MRIIALNFNDNQFSLGIFYEQVNPVHLIVGVLFIAFAFKEAVDNDIFAKQFTLKTLQYDKISLIAQQSLNCPVESYSVTHS